MPYFRVNFSDVESFEPVPEGEYGVEIDKVEVRQNKAGDGLYLNWELTIIDGDYENRKLWLITSLKETALFRLKQVLEGLNVIDADEDVELEYDDDIEPSTKEGPRLLEPDLEGMEAVANVHNEMYEGREQNRVNDLFAERKTKKRSSKPSRNRRDDDYDDNGDGASEERQPRRASASRRSGGSSRRRIR